MMVVEVDQGQRLLTYLTREEIERCGGLPPEGIVGVLNEEGFLTVNSRFREFLQEAIAVLAPLDPGLQEAARRRIDGRVVYIDARVPEDVEPVPDEDILGWFQVRNSRLAAGSYEPNPHHRLQSGRGLSAAISEFRDAMAAELLRRG